MKRPKVTVLMSVYNSEEYLREAIDSILSQTFTDFEFLIINDGSKDDSLKIIKSYKDKRIRLVSRENKGLVASLNEGIQLARGEYLARQDSDDVSLPSRLAKEVSFLENNPDIALVGSNYTVTDIRGKKLSTTNIFLNHDDLKMTLVTCNQYGHGTIMLRKSVLDKVGLYDSSVGRVEDYDLWQRISRIAKVANLEDSLYLYRKNDQGISYSNLDLQIKETLQLRDKAFEHYLSNRKQYKLFNYSPSGKMYRDRKAIMYRDFAYLYAKKDKNIKALFMMLLATLHQPKNKRNYRYILYILYKPRFDRWVYEFL